ncbi:hypothetical protein [Microbacterium sp.]|uniref:hypothetical protein n=1 Tax=Microbacterium sp. TaxID=51671 RepID=UPI003C744D02
MKEDPIVAARRVLDETFELFTTPAGEPFVVPRRGGRAVMLTPKGEGKALGVLRLAAEGYSPRIPRSALVEALTWAFDLAPQAAPSADLHLRAVRTRPDRIVIDLGELHSQRCIVVTPKGWKVRDTPPKGVHFRLSRASRPLPEPQGGDGGKTMRTLLGWGKRDARWLVVRGWLAAASFSDIARPLLFPHGRAGSGKTTRALAIASVFDPRDELGGALGKDERDALVAAGARFVVAWDNVTSVSVETSNFICRLVTGGTDERRSLFTDEDMYVRSIRRTGLITGLSIPLLEPDALERILPIHCEAIRAADRVSEAGLRGEFAAAHPVILGAVLDDVVHVLRHLPKVREMTRERPRQADYSDVLRALDPAIDGAFQELTTDLVREVAESDPFVQAVVGWLRAAQSAGRLPLTMAPAEALVAIRASLPPGGRADTWLPKTPAGLSTMLTKNAGPLAACGFSVSRKVRRGQKLDVYAPLPIERNRS